MQQVTKIIQQACKNQSPLPLLPTITNTMKCLRSRPLAALALTLSLLLSTWSPRVKSKAIPSKEVNSLPLGKTSSSQAAQRKNPSRQVVDSCFRRIPPSKSNPTQNKFDPLTNGG
ncbi:uncharacterized protein LOC114711960 [Neltuma alba]|uniref:uncharacterized protein LOC114711903 n=1 Tax=Neltuma alba TaxID=207710 RepID=UPI0010A34091|nr:uncharacterized protein LOC114711903 [Prosopis alba]XP_028752232.1 uncharacterized protein LOC114711960 [Prosopis alba]